MPGETGRSGTLSRPRGWVEAGVGKGLPTYPVDGRINPRSGTLSRPRGWVEAGVGKGLPTHRRRYFRLERLKI
jgi:hypothetical protein